ncbi:hypothetical protein Niako_3872 [Niastella koreensis GR20-10]|uniref:Uncharacterized protein n=1 Tax=Niastella koreensis (strain DSM 17620 / KACC 11465 / NBRC 106392 / GR20-10) TaxID=700598 RepID=G8T8I8_NIAKG|nr:hypothetical protein Niako_3872 [Niastella koreensis GR20-10]
MFIFSFKKSNLLSKIATEFSRKRFDANDTLSQTIKTITQGKTLNNQELYIEDNCLHCWQATDTHDQSAR